MDNGIEIAPEHRPTIALMGEFSAGKTTLINFLLGDDVLPTRVTATQLPPVWISYGERAAFFVDEDGNETEIDIPELATVGVEGVRYIRLFADTGILSELDLIDTPGISDPNIPLHFREFVAEKADALLWCTHATQAWRESERSALDSMPTELLKHSVLLATRSDKLGVPERRRVFDRLVRETDGRFANIIMFSATEAIEACENEVAGELWQRSGGEELLNTLHHLSVAMNDPDAPRMEPGMFAPEIPEEPAPPTQKTGAVSSTIEDVLVLSSPIAAPSAPGLRAPPPKPAAVTPQEAESGGAVLPRRVRRKDTSRPLPKEAPDAASVKAALTGILSEDTTAEDTPASKETPEPPRAELSVVETVEPIEPAEQAQDDAPEAVDLSEQTPEMATEEPVQEAETPPAEKNPWIDDEPVDDGSEDLIAAVSNLAAEDISAPEPVAEEPVDDESPELAETSEDGSEDVSALADVSDDEPEDALELAEVAESDAEPGLADTDAEPEGEASLAQSWARFRADHAPETMEELETLFVNFLQSMENGDEGAESDTGKPADDAWRLYV